MTSQCDDVICWPHDLKNGDVLFIYMKLKKLGKQANYILNYIYKKENTKGHSNINCLIK